MSGTKTTYTLYVAQGFLDAVGAALYPSSGALTSSAFLTSITGTSGVLSGSTVLTTGATSPAILNDFGLSLATWIQSQLYSGTSSALASSITSASTASSALGTAMKATGPITINSVGTSGNTYSVTFVIVSSDKSAKVYTASTFWLVIMIFLIIAIVCLVGVLIYVFVFKKKPEHAAVDTSAAAGVAGAQ